MRRILWSACAGAAALFGSGCFSTRPLLDNPTLVRSAPAAAVENPVFLPQGPQSYGNLFEMALDVVDDYWEIRYSNRYDGRIITFPRIAPGLERFLIPGSPDFQQRLHATLQTIRHRAEVVIQPVDDGGFLVDVKVYKELEDIPVPERANVGGAAFRSDVTVDRQQEVIDPTFFESKWIPLGRDLKLEQVILERISRWDRKPKCPPAG